MPLRLASTDPDFETGFERLLSLKREVSADVEATVRAIVDDVRAGGDKALCAFTKRFDGLEIAPDGLAINREEIAAARAACDREALDALELAHERVSSYHRRQLPEGQRYRDAVGAELGERWTPVDAAGLYVPGGLASYPSSVIMNAVPAKVAGVARVVMVVPTPKGEINPLVLAAAELAGVDEVYRIGGAQAIAALAYGTETIAPVATIVGPGNAYVAAAKRQVFGRVGIDSIAGPSEVLVISDANNDPDWIAADLLAQAEHDTAAQSILITDDARFADRVAAAVERQLETLSRRAIAGESWEKHGAIITVAALDEAPALANRIAAEHLQLAVDEADELADKISHAGAIFLGRLTPEVIGDYVAGTNHVLPTARSARFSSGLGVLDFMKRTSIVKLDWAALKALGPAAMALAGAEGLEAHGRSVGIRLEADNEDRLS